MVRRTFPRAPQHEGADFLRAMTEVTGQNPALGLSFHAHRLWPFHLVLPQSREEASEGSSSSCPPQVDSRSREALELLFLFMVFLSLCSFQKSPAGSFCIPFKDFIQN